MTKSLEVALAVKALLVSALPGVDVQGIDGEDAAPDRIGSNGLVTLEAGDPGKPEIDLCPVTYNYQHQMTVIVEAAPSVDTTAAQLVDAMLELISAAIEADRFLGGRVDFLDASAPPWNDDYVDAAVTTSGATVTIVATYSSSHPL